MGGWGYCLRGDSVLREGNALRGWEVKEMSGLLHWKGTFFFFFF